MVEFNQDYAPAIESIKSPTLSVETYGERLNEYRKLGRAIFILPTAAIGAIGGVGIAVAATHGTPFPVSLFVPLLGMGVGFTAGSIIGEGFAIGFSRIAARLNPKRI